VTGLVTASLDQIPAGTTLPTPIALLETITTAFADKHIDTGSPFSKQFSFFLINLTNSFYYSDVGRVATISLTGQVLGRCL